MDLVENIKKRFEYGDPCMEKLSTVPIKDIVSVIEKVSMGLLQANFQILVLLSSVQRIL